MCKGPPSVRRRHKPQGLQRVHPLDLAINNAQVPGIEELLLERGAKSSANLLAQKVKFSIPVPKMISYAQQDFCDGGQPADDRKDCLNELETLKLYRELEYNLNRRMSLSMSMGRNPDELVSMTMQQRELKVYSKTMDKVRGRVSVPTALYRLVLASCPGSPRVCIT